MTTAFLLVNGPGKWSLDAVLLRKSSAPGAHKLSATKTQADLSAGAAD